MELLLNYFAVSFLGLILGSFATALTYRIPQSIPWWGRTRSKCTSCNAPLSWCDLIPIASYLLNKGACRHCSAKISTEYPLIETLTMLLCIVTFMLLGWTLQSIIIMALIPILMALLFIDLKYMILPDQLNFIAFMLGVAYIPLTAANIWYEHAFAACMYAAFSWGLGFTMTKFLKKDALGFGDVKFFAVAGLWLGISPFPLFLLLSGVFGVLFGGLWQVIKKENTFPFGPALIIAFMTVLLLKTSQTL